ncbi:MAG: gliding motility-associated C-terminal domain-containing protein, partial [Phycisphaerae bacterium]|nr:gliding motility-associated C-terminal domain-containing protein [Saprospiraceae bacterium]
TYTVTVTDAAGCSAQAPVVIHLLSDPSAAIASAEVVECGIALSKIKFAGTATDPLSTITSVQWFINGVPVPGGNPFEVLLPVHQTDTVQIVATSAQGCTDADTLVFYVPGIPDISVALDSATLNCNGNPVKICIIGGTGLDYGYDWEPDVANLDSLCFMAAPGSTYTVTATDVNTCSATASVNIGLSPPIAISLDASGLNCSGDPVKLCVIGGSTDYGYAWEPAVEATSDSLCFMAAPGATYMLTATDGNNCSATASIAVQAIDSLELTLSQTLILTCSASAQVSATTNIPATIVWTDPNGVVIPSSGGTVTLPATADTVVYTATATVAGSSTCTAVGQVSVTGQGVNVSVNPAAVDTVCSGLPLALSVNVTPQGVSYLWSVDAPAMLSDSTSPNPVLNGPAGDYIVSVIIVNEANTVCTDSLSFPVKILDTIDLSGQISIGLCHGLVVSFTNPTGIGGSWDFGDSSPVSNDVNPVHTYDSAGVYTPVFTPSVVSPCLGPWSSTITVFDSALTVGIAHSYVNCALEAVIQFNGTTNHTGSNFWDWKFPGGTPATSTVQNPIITYPGEGTYFVALTLTDINHCTATATDSITLYIISDILDDSLKICLGDSIRLNHPVGIDPDADYEWGSVPLDPTLLGQEHDPNPVVSPKVPTVYTATISQGACSVTYSLAVGFKPSSDVHIVADSASSVCSADDWLLIAQSIGATKFEWSTSDTFMPVFDTLKTVHVMPNGIYFVRASGDAVCPTVDSILIDLKIPEIQVIPADHDICLGEEAALMFTNLIPGDNLTCDWGPDLPTGCDLVVSPDDTTTYVVIVTNQYGCKDTLSFTVNVTSVSVDADATPDVVTLENPTTILTATPGGNGTVVSYEWTPPGTLSSPHTAQTEATPTETTIYTVTVTTEDGCTATDTVMVIFRHNECISPFVFIPKAFTPNNDQKNDFFIPLAAGMTALKFIIWDRWGEIVYETNDPNALGWDGTYKGKEATPDAFAWYVLLTCGNGDIYESKGNVTLLK